MRKLRDSDIRLFNWFEVNLESLTILVPLLFLWWIDEVGKGQRIRQSSSSSGTARKVSKWKTNLFVTLPPWKRLVEYFRPVSENKVSTIYMRELVNLHVVLFSLSLFSLDCNFHTTKIKISASVCRVSPFSIFNQLSKIYNSPGIEMKLVKYEKQEINEFSKFKIFQLQISSCKIQIMVVITASWSNRKVTNRLRIF